MKLTLVNKIIRCLRWTFFVICMLVMTACQNRSDSQNSQAPAPTKQESKPPSSETDGGVGNTGGGNTSSVQTKNTLEFFSNDGADLRKDLIGWLKELRQFASQGSISSDIHEMIDGGLIEDIEKSKFVFSESCSDSKGNITSMSTLKVNNFLSEVKHPDICINVPKIGTEKASYNDILGNL
ncbi:MAG: hypothetical protein JNM24_05830, partial [Bdellovibrionaceae bacterium]|nr:hypothetical protein [Pseudobdellovibrionaceae bacterium]